MNSVNVRKLSLKRLYIRSFIEESDFLSSFTNYTLLHREFMLASDLMNTMTTKSSTEKSTP